MKVLMTADTVGDVFAYALELSAALGRAGAEVALATKGGVLSPEQWAAARRVPGLEVFESPDRPEWAEDPWPDVARSAAWLLDLADRFRPDVVHLNDYAHGALPFEAPRLVVVHACLCCWYEAARRPPPPGLDRYRAEVARGLAGADLVVAPTRAAIQALESHCGPVPRWRVVPHGRSPPRDAPGEKEPFVLCGGRRWGEPERTRLLDAVAEGLRWPVLLAGGAAPLDPAHGAPPPRHARALGRLGAEALACFYRRAAVYALPARYEPLGLSVLEAALAGCALVLGDTPSLREAWGGAAVFVDPDSPEMLRLVLAGLAEREDLRDMLGGLARGRALTYSPERMAAGYLEAYRDLIAERTALGRELAAGGR